MLPPRFELGPCADLALTGYKPAALPFELRELLREVLPPGLEPGPHTDLVLTHCLPYRSRRLSYGSKLSNIQWVWWDSNPHLTD